MDAGGGSGMIKIQKNTTVLSLSTQFLDPVAPNKKDRCVFVKGKFKSQSGTLIGMDQGDAIIKLDSNNDFNVVPLNTVCKLHE